MLIEDLIKIFEKTNRTQTFTILCKEFHVENAVEVGVLQACFATDLLEKTHIKRLIGVDINHCPNALDLQNKYSGRYMFVQGSSPEISSVFLDSSLDLVYLDGCHAKNHVYSELEAWWPKVRPGKIFAGHDFLKFTSDEGEVYGVIEDVILFCLSNGLQLYVTGTQEVSFAGLLTYGERCGHELIKRANGQQHNFVEAPSWWIIKKE